MTNAQKIIQAALDHGPMFFEPRKYNGWHVQSQHRRSPGDPRPPRKRYFRTMDVNRVIASGFAKQIGNQVVKA